MRTTLTIDDDILQAAKEIAVKEKKTAGTVLSELARKGFSLPQITHPPTPRTRNGVEMFPRRGEQVTLAHVRKLLDDLDA